MQYLRAIRPWLPALGMIAACVLAAPPARAWDRGVNAGSWTKGATLNIYVDDIPGTAPEGTSEAVDEAIKEWNDAQAPLGGLKLVKGATKENADIHIVWDKDIVKKYGDWGLTAKKNDRDKKDNGFSKETVRMRIDIADGLNSRGITRILKHELGHAEGLSHSAKSDVMKANLNGKGRKPPTAEDLNSTDPYKDPNDDDKAGKKELWGTAPKQSSSNTNSGHSYNTNGSTTYTYSLAALTGPGFTDPVTELTIELSSGITLADFDNFVMPTGWQVNFWDGTVDTSGTDFHYSDDQPSLLSFTAGSPSYGVLPGDTAFFSFTSFLTPTQTRSFTNSPDWDSDEALVFSPDLVPEPGTVAALGMGAMGLMGLVWRRRRTNVGG
jgi:hypothetical protein